MSLSVTPYGKTGPNGALQAALLADARPPPGLRAWVDPQRRTGLQRRTDRAGRRKTQGSIPSALTPAAKLPASGSQRSPSPSAATSSPLQRPSQVPSPVASHTTHRLVRAYYRLTQTYRVRMAHQLAVPVSAFAAIRRGRHTCSTAALSRSLSREVKSHQMRDSLDSGMRQDGARCGGAVPQRTAVCRCWKCESLGRNGRDCAGKDSAQSHYLTVASASSFNLQACAMEKETSSKRRLCVLGSR